MQTHTREDREKLLTLPIEEQFICNLESRHGICVSEQIHRQIVAELRTLINTEKATAAAQGKK